MYKLHVWAVGLEKEERGQSPSLQRFLQLCVQNSAAALVTVLDMPSPSPRSYGKSGLRVRIKDAGVLCI